MNKLLTFKIYILRGVLSLLIKSIKINKSYVIFCVIFFIIISAFLAFSIIYPFSLPTNSNNLVWTNSIDTATENRTYIKWVDFNVTYDVLDKTSRFDINSHSNNEPVKYNWIELISYLACKYGGNFKKFKQNDLIDLTDKLKNGTTMSELTKNLKNYSYYYEAYDTILHEFIGEYEVELPNDARNRGKNFYKKIWCKSIFAYC